MEQIAFILGEHAIAWSFVIRVLASVGALCLFLGIYFSKGGTPAAGSLTAILAAALSLLCARALHWYCFAETYSGFLPAMTDYSAGGLALLGAFAGCLGAAALTRLTGLHENLPGMLDCMTLAGSAGIAAGRLASFFNASDRGRILAAVTTMPWAYPVTNAVSGATEYRFATFLLQAIVAAVLFVWLMLFYYGKHPTRRPGDTTLLFLLCYCASQIVLDSTRYDSIYFRFNGFVSIVQVVSALTLAGVLVTFSVRMVKSRGFHGFFLVLWLGIAALIACAGYMEYHVQRHGNEAVFAYSVMSVNLAAVVLLGLLLRALSLKPTHPAGKYLRR